MLLVVLACAQSICADELPDECEAAVDAADRLNSDNSKHCDYSKTGLNGVLHKAFANKAAASEQGAKEAQSPKVTAPEQAAKVIADTAAPANLPRALAREFDSAARLNTVRYELLQLASKECAAGFVLLDERYLPSADKRLTFVLNYRCL